MDHDVEFIGVDGEGVTRADGSHDYVLLTCGDRNYFTYAPGDRLHFVGILGFLWAQYQTKPKATYVGYYLGYDFAQWIRDLPEERARMLLSKEGIAKRKRTAAKHLPPFPVQYEGWDFDILGQRRFKLRPQGETRWMVINDAGPFFQCSFLKAIDPKSWPTPIVSEAEYALIKSGKEQRATAEFNDAMVVYNKLECKVLARLMTLVNQGLVSENIKLRKDQWFGPGQAAQAWLGNIKAPTREETQISVPIEFREAARATYFGGWFEIFHHGLWEGPSYSYDLNSAYPRIMSTLPCLRHAKLSLKWYPHALTIWHGEVTGTDPYVGAMLHRTATGKVLRPHKTKGWFWATEIEMAQRARLVDQIAIYREMHLLPQCDCPPPFAAIADLYQGRLEVGKNTPRGRALKLIYNSGYGKLAQSIGEPKFANAIYASLITSGCRSMILSAIASHRLGAESLLMVATDGVTFKHRHERLELDDRKLGAWTETVHNNLSLFMPGVYWDEMTRQRLGAPGLKSRGISAGDLSRSIDVIDRAWGRVIHDGWPRLRVPVAFQLISPRQALARGKWGLCGSVVTDGARVISADPKAKRGYQMPGHMSFPYEQADQLESTPYDGRFGEEISLYNEMEFGDHAEGPLGMLMAETLRG